MSNTTPVVATEKKSLVRKFADKFSIEAGTLMETLKKTAFKSTTEITTEQMAALLVVADQYGLNPFTREIYAFPDKGGIVPVVGVDGWMRIANENPFFDGLEFAYSSEMRRPDPNAPECHAWIEVALYRKDRSQPIKIREYLDECFKPTTPWKSHPKRMLRHKALVQCLRVGFGFSGIYDQDEAERIVEANGVEVVRSSPAVTDINKARQPVARIATSSQTQLQVDNFIDRLIAQTTPSGAWTTAESMIRQRIDASFHEYAFGRLNEAKNAITVDAEVVVESQPDLLAEAADDFM